MLSLLEANDEMAMGAIDVPLQSRLWIPEDLAVIGFDDIQMAAVQLLGESAVAFLFDRLQTPTRSSATRCWRPGLWCGNPVGAQSRRTQIPENTSER